MFKSIFISMDSNYKYIVYKTTNLINGKIYIGCHKTLNLEDDYLGSGTMFKRALLKYGKENFKREILHQFNNAEEMYKKEAELVNESFVSSDDNYNLTYGGAGSWHFCNSQGKNLYGKNGDEDHGRKNLWKMDKLKPFLIENNLWEDWKRKVSSGLKETYAKEGFHWLGKKHKEESKRKIGLKNSIHQKGKNNSQFGTCWVYSDIEKKSLKIKRDDLNQYLNSGWIEGRKIKF